MPAAHFADGSSGHMAKVSSFEKRTTSFLGTVLLCLLSSTCGYHTAGHAVTVPDDVHTVAIPAFVNQTHTYKIDQMLTEAVVHEMITRTHYRILNQADSRAHARLQGRLLSTAPPPLTYESTTRR